MLVVIYAIKVGQCTIRCIDNEILGETETSLYHERCLVHMMKIIISFGKKCSTNASEDRAGI